MLVSVLHFFTADDQVRRIVEPLVDALPPGSYVAASHATSEFAPATLEAGRAYTRGGVDVIGRDGDIFAGLVFRGLTLVPPGVVVVSEWRPEPGAILPPRAEVSNNGAVARKPLSRISCRTWSCPGAPARKPAAAGRLAPAHLEELLASPRATLPHVLDELEA